MSIEVSCDGQRIAIDAGVFHALFDDSVVSSRKTYLEALDSGQIKLNDLVMLSRVAQIPYGLFFAPIEVVQSQLTRKTETLLRGVSKQTFSLNSRNTIRLSDVELIVKDLLRKQQLLKKLDRTLVENEIVGVLRRPRSTVAADAAALQDVLELNTGDLMQARTKQKAFDLLVERLEDKQVLVAQSQRGYMPQQLRGVKFSGLCVKDRKVPYVFVASGDESVSLEPTGRRLFTLVLLSVLVARGKFAPVTYQDHTGELIANREYEITEEILMPSGDVRDRRLGSLDEVKEVADLYRVTPSAMVMRGRRLGVFDRTIASEYLAILREEFANRGKQHRRGALAVNALRKYNGVEFSRRMVRQLDAGRITPSEFCRVVFLNKLRASAIADFRSTL